MGIMDLIIEELNNNLTEEQKENGDSWERLNSDQYQIVQTENELFHNYSK